MSCIVQKGWILYISEQGTALRQSQMSGQIFMEKKNESERYEADECGGTRAIGAHRNFRCSDSETGAFQSWVPLWRLPIKAAQCMLVQILQAWNVILQSNCRIARTEARGSTQDIRGNQIQSHRFSTCCSSETFASRVYIPSTSTEQESI